MNLKKLGAHRTPRISFTILSIVLVVYDILQTQNKFWSQASVYVGQIYTYISQFVILAFVVLVLILRKISHCQKFLKLVILVNKLGDFTECNYAKGRWIADDRRPLYSGTGCKQWLSDMWSCRLTLRTDFSYEAYRWQPEACDMPEFEGSQFLRRCTQLPKLSFEFQINLQIHLFLY